MTTFVNLSNGIERATPGCRFVRIQSTWCEQKRWWPIILDLDYTFLMEAALGPVVVLDSSAHKNVPRAVYQGLEWVKYVLNRRWLGIETKPMVRSMNVQVYFRRVYDEESSDRSRAFNKLDYVARLTSPTSIDISAITWKTALDGKVEELSAILKGVT